MTASPKYNFTTVPGFFKHDEEPTGPEFRAKTLPSLGLLKRSYSSDESFDPNHEQTQWGRFTEYMSQLNANSGGSISYKLLFVLRHGQGNHNVKESEVGRIEWERHWARLDGDDQMAWADAHLTAKGKSQAQAVYDFLRKSEHEDNMLMPSRHYTSPLARCLETCKLAFSRIDPLSKSLQGPIIKEKLRETLGIHTCDRRSTRTWIQGTYPDFTIEEGLSENDELWKPDTRESLVEHGFRVQELLDDIFTHEEETVISFTAHSGAIRTLYAVTGHRDVWVGAGALVPILIKAERLRGHGER